MFLCWSPGVCSVPLTNHLSLIVDHHCQVLKDLVYIQNVRLKHTNTQTRGWVSCGRREGRLSRQAAGGAQGVGLTSSCLMLVSRSLMSSRSSSVIGASSVCVVICPQSSWLHAHRKTLFTESNPLE